MGEKHASGSAVGRLTPPVQQLFKCPLARPSTRADHRPRGKQCHRSQASTPPTFAAQQQLQLSPRIARRPSMTSIGMATKAATESTHDK